MESADAAPRFGKSAAATGDAADAPIAALGYVNLCAYARLCQFMFPISYQCAFLREQTLHAQLILLEVLTLMHCEYSFFSQGV